MQTPCGINTIRVYIIYIVNSSLPVPNHPDVRGDSPEGSSTSDVLAPVRKIVLPYPSRGKRTDPRLNQKSRRGSC